MYRLDCLGPADGSSKLSVIATGATFLSSLGFENTVFQPYIAYNVVLHFFGYTEVFVLTSSLGLE